MKELDTVGEGDLGVWEGVEGFICKSGGEVLEAIGVGNSLSRVLKLETGCRIFLGRITCCKDWSLVKVRNVDVGSELFWIDGEETCPLDMVFMRGCLEVVYLSCSWLVVNLISCS